MTSKSSQVMSKADRLAATLGTLRRAAGHPAVWVFVACYCAAAIALVATGNTASLAIELGLAVFLAVLVLITLALTVAAPSSTPRADDTSTTTWRVWAQLGVLAVVVLFTLYAGMVLNDTAPRLPVFYDSVRAIYHLTTLALNPILYVIVPGILLLVLGARLGSLGLARGRRSWAVSALWGIGPAIAIAIALATSRLSALDLLNLLIGNTLRNGPMEEFLWRGAVLTRLRLLVGTPWSMVISSLAFGIWHIGTNLRAFQGQWVPAVAFCIISQAAIGLAFAIVLLRTRNLLASSVAHVLLNLASGLFG